MGTGLLQFRGLFVFLRYYLGPSQVVTVGVTVLCDCRLCRDGSVPHRAVAVSSSYNMTQNNLYTNCHEICHVLCKL